MPDHAGFTAVLNPVAGDAMPNRPLVNLAPFAPPEIRSLRDVTALICDLVNTPTNSDVDNWFAQLEYPFNVVMQRVRHIIIGTDKRLSEYVQYGAVQVKHKGRLCSFVQVKDLKREPHVQPCPPAETGFSTPGGQVREMHVFAWERDVAAQSRAPVNHQRLGRLQGERRTLARPVPGTSSA
jgi:hypothetical protein